MLAQIEVKFIEHETDKSLFVNANLWIPKNSIIKHNKDNLIVKSWFLKDKEFEYKKLSWLDVVDRNNLKPLEQYINQQSCSYFPLNAMKHQEKAFNFAKGLKTVALFMEMGTGKSKLYIDLANYHYECKNINKVLFFAPPTTLDNFKNELKLWQTSNLEWDILSVCNLSIREFTLKAENLLKKIDNQTMVIIDESHRIQNINSLMSRLAYVIGKKTNYKIIGTGTPAGNSPENLIGQFRFLTPDEFNISLNQLKKRYFKIGDKGIIKGGKNELELIEKTFSYTYSITKKQCLDLPSKIHYNIDVNCDKLLDFYHNEYNEVKTEFMDSTGSLMGFLQNLRKLSSGRNKEKEVVIKNPKIDVLKDLLQDITEKTIIWHNFYHEIDDILQVIKKDYVLLNGDMTKLEKSFAINEFKNNENVKYLIATESVGGVGLNLTESSTSIYFSNSFSLVDRLQSEDRVHRIGTKNQCVYYDLITNGTIDNKIKRSLYRKADFLNDLQEVYKKEGKEAVIKRLEGM